MASRIKWWLMVYWASGQRVAARNPTDEEPIGAWNRVKRYLMTRWTDEILLAPTVQGDTEMGLGPVAGGAVAEGLGETIETAVVPAVRTAVEQEVEVEPVFEGRISGVMVEERRDTGELVAEDMTEEGALKVPNGDGTHRRGRSAGA